MSLNEELGFNALARMQNNFSIGVKIAGALAGTALLVKGWSGSSDPFNPLYASVGTLMATPAVVSGILKEAAYVTLSEKFGLSARDLAWAGAALASFSIVPLVSIQTTEQAEIHQARVDACNGAQEGRISFRYKGTDSFVDCKTMLPPVQEPYIK
jgi:hypothetical protein